ncbi:hypothetical protein RvY_14537 [Ramazzottius varieornatus]|uniref:Uncharacterized protein n=1 Tax=Ramazzottius varieornatus TaxID=947166 RepID=A0A1D1VRP2_RAMVA|nr:hypothetical protein RvY_14537 [Ramazzottius varieornatus]
MPKKGGKSLKKELDPLPGPSLLHLVAKYSKDDPNLPRNDNGLLPNAGDFERPPFDDDSEEADDGSLQENIPPELILDFGDRLDIDKYEALISAEEDSDDGRSLSSLTEDLEEEVKGEPADGNESGATESESTGGETDLEGYDVPEWTSSESSVESREQEPEVWSEEKDDSDEANIQAEEPKVVEKVPAAPPRPVKKSLSFNEPITKAKSDWIARQFADLFMTKSDPQLPLYTSVKDLLETNLDFGTMGPEVLEKLNAIATASSTLNTQNSGDFERPPSSIRSSSAESVRKKAPSENKVSVITNKKENKASSRATPRGKVTPKLSRLLPLPPKTASIRRYPAELYDEGRRTKFPEKAFVHRNELLTTTEEQDALVTESCEDLSFLEYRRERVLRGQKVPIGRKDLEVDVVASRLAKKLLQYEAAVDKHLPDADWVDEEEREPYDDEQALPRKPLVPIAVNPNEDPNDEDTSSAEDEPKGGTMKKPKRSITAVPYKVPTPVHEDDQHDYYNSDRSSSDCEPVEDIIKKEISTKIKARHKPEVMTSALPPLELAGHQYDVSVPLSHNELQTVPVDDLYALAHDLEMPPSVLRKELHKPENEMDFDEDSDDEGWKHVRGAFLYEKTPDYYAVQIKDLEQQVRLRRELWLQLEVDYQEASGRNKTEYSAMVQFIDFLLDQRDLEKQKVAKLNLKLEELQNKAQIQTEYQNTCLAWLQLEKQRLVDQFAARKEYLQMRLHALREYPEKQRQMETQLKFLQRQARRTKAEFTKKVSTMLLNSARRKNELFRQYEKRVGVLFKEYQRALVLSMNDNLQEAVKNHVEGRKRAKKFSDDASVAIESYKKCDQRLDATQREVQLKKELLSVSTKHGRKLQRHLRDLQEVRKKEAAKVLEEGAEDPTKVGETGDPRVTGIQQLSLENKTLASHVEILREQKDKTQNYLNAEQSVSKDMDKQLQQLAQTIKDYLSLCQKSGSDPLPSTPSNLNKIESFEDRLIRFLHYSEEVDHLVNDKVERKPSWIADGDLGLMRKPKPRKL